MTGLPSKCPGAGAIAFLTASFITVAWLIARERSVKLSEVGPAIVAREGIGWPDMRVNINTAEISELALLPGLGPSLAERIVEHRQTNGEFASVDDLSMVKGIGSAIIDRMRPFIVVDTNSTKGSLPSTR
jgi:competence ComEA-like helix-hairpin-helix protein